MADERCGQCGYDADNCKACPSCGHCHELHGFNGVYCQWQSPSAIICPCVYDKTQAARGKDLYPDG